jgi:hypothetical protein
LHPLEIKLLRKQLEQEKETRDRGKKMSVVTDKKKKNRGGSSKANNGSSKDPEHDTEGDDNGEGDEYDDEEAKKQKKARRVSSHASQNFSGGGGLEASFNTYVTDNKEEDATKDREQVNADAWELIHDVDYLVTGGAEGGAAADVEEVLRHAGAKRAKDMEFLPDYAVRDLFALLKEGPQERFIDIIEQAKKAARFIKKH